MILHKIARAVTGDAFYADTWHDIAGYALLIEKYIEDQNRLSSILKNYKKGAN